VLPIGKASLNLCFLEHPVDFGAADRQLYELRAKVRGEARPIPFSDR
jgi:hypothetical protein